MLGLVCFVIVSVVICCLGCVEVVNSVGIDAVTFIVCSLILLFLCAFLVCLCLLFGWFSTLRFVCGDLLVIWLV